MKYSIFEIGKNTFVFLIYSKGLKTPSQFSYLNYDAAEKAAQKKAKKLVETRKIIFEEVKDFKYRGLPYKIMEIGKAEYVLYVPISMESGGPIKYSYVEISWEDSVSLNTIRNQATDAIDMFFESLG